MRIFVTGATGFIGSAVVPELKAAGHEVLGLARTDDAVDALAKMGAQSHRGELTDKESLVAGALACDGVIHMGFIHDFLNHAANVETDRQAVEAMLGALEGSGKPFVLTSGTALLAPGQKATEDAMPAPGVPRGASEELAMAAVVRGVRTSIVRLSPSVHGAGDHGFIPMLIDFARRTGISAYIGDGANRWPAVHRLDAANLFRLSFEKAVAGTRLHGAAEEGIPMRTIAETIGAEIDVPIRSITMEEAVQHFGWMARFAAIDNPTSSAYTRETIGWSPKELDLLTDMKESGYFA